MPLRGLSSNTWNKPNTSPISKTPTRGGLNSNQVNEAQYGIKYDPASQSALAINPTYMQTGKQNSLDTFKGRAKQNAAWGSSIHERLLNNIQKKKDLELSAKLNNQLNTVAPGFARATGGTAADIRQSVGITPNKGMSSPGGLSPFRSEILERARKYLGTPYTLGGGHQPNATTPSKGYNGIYGLDCSGLTGIVFRQMGINLPGIANQQSVYGKRTNIANAKPGDLVGWNRGGHIAIYIGNGQILHAPQPGSVVQIRSLFKGEQVFAVSLTLPGD